MKRILSLLIILAGLSAPVIAGEKEDALQFFNDYVKAANTYSTTIPNMYSPNAKIIRQVVKPDGTIVTRQTNTARYISEMRKGQAIAKVRRYKNYYSNVSVVALGNNKFKVSSLRQPSGESYKLKAYMIVKQLPNGKWIITEEMMQTKVQMLINAK